MSYIPQANRHLRHMIKHTKRAIVFLVGFILVIFGLAAFALPIIPGIVFVVVGLLLLSTFSPSMREWIDKHTRRFPKVHEGVAKIQHFISRIVGET